MHNISPAPTRVHVGYLEPHPLWGSTWTSPPRCVASQAAAEELIAATTRSAGPDAAARRTWKITDCDCGARINYLHADELSDRQLLENVLRMWTS